MINKEADEVIKDLFDSLKKNIKIVWNQSNTVSLYSKIRKE